MNEHMKEVNQFAISKGYPIIFNDDCTITEFGLKLLLIGAMGIAKETLETLFKILDK